MMDEVLCELIIIIMPEYVCVSVCMYVCMYADLQ